MYACKCVWEFLKLYSYFYFAYPCNKEQGDSISGYFGDEFLNNL